MKHKSKYDGINPNAREVSDADRIRAGRDPRQTHFVFYLEPVQSPGPPRRARRRPSRARRTRKHG
jgi:hypothetical protein